MTRNLLRVATIACLLSTSVQLATAEILNPKHDGNQIELGACRYLGTIASGNAVPCRGNDCNYASNSYEHPGKAAVGAPRSICSESGSCSRPKIQTTGVQTCRLCGGVSLDMGWKTDFSWAGGCETVSMANHHHYLRNALTESWHITGMGNSTSRSPIPLANDTLNFRRWVYVNTPDPGQYIFTTEKSLLFDDRPRGRSQGYPVMGVGLQPQRSDNLASDKGNFPLASLTFDRWARRDTSLRPFTQLPSANLKQETRLNISDWLVGIRNITEDTPRIELWAKNTPFPITAADVTTGSSWAALAGTDQLATAVASGSDAVKQSPFTQAGFIATEVPSDQWTKLEQERILNLGVGQQPFTRNYFKLDLYGNTFAAGANPRRSLFYQSPQWNSYDDYIELLIPIQPDNGLTSPNVAGSSSVGPTVTGYQGIDYRGDPLVNIEEVAGIAFRLTQLSGKQTLSPILLNSTTDTSSPFPPDVVLPNLDTFVPTSFDTSERSTLFDSIKLFLTANHKIAHWGEDQYVVYIPGETKARFYGNNTNGQFGVGAANVGRLYQGEEESVQGILGGATISSWALGGTHSVVRTSLKGGYLSGFMADSNAGCGLSDSDTFVQVTGANFADTDQVDSVAAGLNFTIFLLKSGSDVHVCGGRDFMSEKRVDLANPGGNTRISTLWVPNPAPVGYIPPNYTEVCTGRAFACVGLVGAVGRGRMNYRCWGASDLTLNGVATVFAFGPDTCEPEGCLRWGDSAGAATFRATSTGYHSFDDVDTLTCGDYHIVATMFEKFGSGTQVETQSDHTQFGETRVVFTAGSNTRGQLGAYIHPPNSGVAASVKGAVYPVSPVDERVFSSRAMNRVEWRIDAAVDAATLPYQMYEIQSAHALGNTTIVHTSIRLFNTLADFRRNASSYLSTGSAPDSAATPGWSSSRLLNTEYDLRLFSSDSVRDVIGNAALQATFNAASWPPNFFVDWDVLPGLGMVLLSNQTDETAWTTFNTDNEGTSHGGAWATADLGVNGVAPFFRNWYALGRNITTLSSNGVEAVTTMQIPQFWYRTSSGRVYAQNQLEVCKVGALPANCYCDAKTKKLIWGHTSVAAGVPTGGYTHIIDKTTNWWVSLYVTVKVVNVTYPATTGTENATAIAEALEAQGDEGRHLLPGSPFREVYYMCDPFDSMLDCSSGKWYEGFAITRSHADVVDFTTSLSPGTFAAVHRTTNSSSYGYFQDGIAGHVPRYFDLNTLSEVGDQALELYPLDYNEATFTAADAPGFKWACIFVKVREKIFWLRLRVDKTLQRCEPPTEIGNSTWVGAGGVQGTWSMDYGDNLLTLHDIDPAFINVYSTAAHYMDFDPAQVTFELSCASGVALSGTNGTFKNKGDPLRYSHGSYIYFTNTSSLQRVWLHQTRNVASDWALINDSSTFGLPPLGCDGGFITPVTPAVKQFSAFEMTTRTNSSSFGDATNDRLVVEISSLGAAGSSFTVNQQHRYRLHLGQDGIDVMQNSFGVDSYDLSTNPGSDAGTYPVSSNEWTVKSSIVNPTPGSYQGSWAGIALPPPAGQIFCLKRFWWPTEWHRLLLKYDRATDQTFIYWNDDLVCQGFMFNAEFHTQRVVNVYVGLYNSVQRPQTVILVDEMVFCNADPNNNDPTSVFPCKMHGAGLANDVFPSETFSLSGSETITQTDTKTENLTDSNSFTHRTHSETTTQTESQSVSDGTFSPTMTETLTQSDGSSSISVSRSDTLMMTESYSFSQEKNPHLEMKIFQESVSTAHNVRRSGVDVTVALREDQFDAAQDWENSCAVLFTFSSSVPLDTNPNGFMSSRYRKGFLNCKVMGSYTPTGMIGNFSELKLTIGPDKTYNAFRDETITFTMRPAGAGSKFPVSGSVSFPIEGRGFLVDDKLRAVEAANGLSALIAAGIMANPSATFHAATLSLIVNFHCFNNEDVPMSYIIHPGRILVDGDPKLGAFVVNLTTILLIPIIGLAIAYAIHLKTGVTIRKAQSRLYFPGIAIVMCAMLLPGFLHGAWQYALEKSTWYSFGGVGLATVVVTVSPLIYLLSKLYDDANFCAKYKAFEEGDIHQMRTTSPFWGLFVIPGEWTSTDRDIAFVKRFAYCIQMFTPRRKYWMTVELFEAICIGIATSVINSSRVVCFAELAVVMGLRLGHFIALWKLVPIQTPFLHYYLCGILAAQTLVIIIKMADVVRGETRLVETLLYLSFSLLTATMMCMNFLFMAVKARAYYHQRRVIKMVQKGGKAVQAVVPKTHFREEGGLDREELGEALLRVNEADDEEGIRTATADRIRNRLHGTTAGGGAQEMTTILKPLPDANNDKGAAGGELSTNASFAFGGGGPLNSSGNSSFANPSFANPSFAATGNNVSMTNDSMFVPQGFVVDCDFKDLRPKSPDGSSLGGGSPHGTDLGVRGARAQVSPAMRDPMEEQGVPKERDIWRLLALEEAQNQRSQPINYHDDDL